MLKNASDIILGVYAEPNTFLTQPAQDKTGFLAKKIDESILAGKKHKKKASKSRLQKNMMKFIQPQEQRQAKNFVIHDPIKLDPRYINSKVDTQQLDLAERMRRMQMRMNGNDAELAATYYEDGYDRVPMHMASKYDTARRLQDGLLPAHEPGSGMEERNKLIMQDAFLKEYFFIEAPASAKLLAECETFMKQRRRAARAQERGFSKAQLHRGGIHDEIDFGQVLERAAKRDKKIRERAREAKLHPPLKFGKEIKSVATEQVGKGLVFPGELQQLWEETAQFKTAEAFYEAKHRDSELKRSRAEALGRFYEMSMSLREKGILDAVHGERFRLQKLRKGAPVRVYNFREAFAVGTFSNLSCYISPRCLNEYERDQYVKKRTAELKMRQEKQGLALDAAATSYRQRKAAAKKKAENLSKSLLHPLYLDSSQTLVDIAGIVIPAQTMMTLIRAVRRICHTREKNLGIRDTALAYTASDKKDAMANTTTTMNMYEEVDRLARVTLRQDFKTLDVLVAYLTSHPLTIQSERMKARVLYRWCCEHVRLALPSAIIAAKKRKKRHQRHQLKSREATATTAQNRSRGLEALQPKRPSDAYNSLFLSAADFGSLYQSMCTSAGVFCLLSVGYGRAAQVGVNCAEALSQPNHIWNIVYYENDWRFIDIPFSISLGRRYDIADIYFDCPKHLFDLQHFGVRVIGPKGQIGEEAILASINAKLRRQHMSYHMKQAQTSEAIKRQKKIELEKLQEQKLEEDMKAAKAKAERDALYGEDDGLLAVLSSDEEEKNENDLLSATTTSSSLTSSLRALTPSQQKRRSTLFGGVLSPLGGSNGRRASKLQTSARRISVMSSSSSALLKKPIEVANTLSSMDEAEEAETSNTRVTTTTTTIQAKKAAAVKKKLEEDELRQEAAPPAQTNSLYADVLAFEAGVFVGTGFVSHQCAMLKPKDKAFDQFSRPGSRQGPDSSPRTWGNRRSSISQSSSSHHHGGGASSEQKQQTVLARIVAPETRKSRVQLKYSEVTRDVHLLVPVKLEVLVSLEIDGARASHVSFRHCASVEYENTMVMLNDVACREVHVKCLFPLHGNYSLTIAGRTKSGAPLVDLASELVVVHAKYFTLPKVIAAPRTAASRGASRTASRAATPKLSQSRINSVGKDKFGLGLMLPPGATLPSNSRSGSPVLMTVPGFEEVQSTSPVPFDEGADDGLGDHEKIAVNFLDGQDVSTLHSETTPGLLNVRKTPAASPKKKLTSQLGFRFADIEEGDEDNQEKKKKLPQSALPVISQAQLQEAKVHMVGFLARNAQDHRLPELTDEQGLIKGVFADEDDEYPEMTRNVSSSSELQRDMSASSTTDDLKLTINTHANKSSHEKVVIVDHSQFSLRQPGEELLLFRHDDVETKFELATPPQVKHVWVVNHYTITELVYREDEVFVRSRSSSRTGGKRSPNNNGGGRRSPTGLRKHHPQMTGSSNGASHHRRTVSTNLASAQRSARRSVMPPATARSVQMPDRRLSQYMTMQNEQLSLLCPQRKIFSGGLIVHGHWQDLRIFYSTTDSALDAVLMYYFSPPREHHLLASHVSAVVSNTQRGRIELDGYGRAIHQQLQVTKWECAAVQIRVMQKAALKVRPFSLTFSCREGVYVRVAVHDTDELIVLEENTFGIEVDEPTSAAITTTSGILRKEFNVKLRVGIRGEIAQRKLALVITSSLNSTKGPYDVLFTAHL